MHNRIYRHLARQAHSYLWLVVAMVAFGRHYAVTVNLSESLPGTLFLIQKGVHPAQGDLAAFLYNGGGPYPRGAWFVKQLVGSPGGTVSAVNAGDGLRDYYVNEKFVGRAKPLSRAGKPLIPGPAGIIPPHRYYMAAPHPDSLDSRYALVGWVSDDQIIGKAYRIY